MKNILLIFRQSILRNKLMLILAAAAGLLLGWIFIIQSSPQAAQNLDHIDIGILDYDKSSISDNLKSYLSDTLDMNVTENNNYDSLLDMLINEQISAIIEIPHGMFESILTDDFQELVITTLNDYENAAFVEAYLNSYMQGIPILSAASNGNPETLKSMLNADNTSGSVIASDDYNTAVNSVGPFSAYCVTVGFLIMIISGITLFLSSSILTDKQLGTYRRMQCSSIKPSEYIIGISAFGIMACSLMFIIFLMFPIMKKSEIGISYGLALLCGELFVLFSVGISIVFALCIRSNQTLFTVVCGYATIGSMLGGAWFPISKDLGFLSSLAKIFPQHWFMNMIREMPGNSEYNCIPNILILALSALLVYLISAVIFTKKSS